MDNNLFVFLCFLLFVTIIFAIIYVHFKFYFDKCPKDGKNHDYKLINNELMSIDIGFGREHYSYFEYECSKCGKKYTTHN